VGYYHLMSRTVNGEALFGEAEKEVFRRMIWKAAGFSRVRVIFEPYQVVDDAAEGDRFEEERARLEQILNPDHETD